MKRSNKIMRHLYSRWCLLFWIVLASVQLEKIKMHKLIMIGFWLWQTGKFKITKFLAKNGCTIQKMYWLCWQSSMSKWYAIQKIFKNVSKLLGWDSRRHNFQNWWNCLKYEKNWKYQKQKITFSWNKQNIQFCLERCISRSYRF